MHGGIDGGTEAEEVMGQQQIHEKIVQLNFKDCHAKIRKVMIAFSLDSYLIG